MNHIGNIIKQYRKQINMSQRELAEGLCSPKYIYFIEKGERSPSTALCRDFSHRLGVDLFDLCQYLECDDPVVTYETVRLFERYRRRGNFVKLHALTDLKKTDPDFRRLPWRCELIINKYLYMLYHSGDAQEAVAELPQLIASVEKSKLLDYHLAQLHILLSIAFMKTGDYESAEKSNNVALLLVVNKENMAQYKPICVLVQLNYLNIRLNAADYEAVLRDGKALLRFQQENGFYESVQHTYFLLAKACLARQDAEMSVYYCTKAAAAIFLNCKPAGIIHPADNDAVSQALKLSSVSEKLLDVFRDSISV